MELVMDEGNENESNRIPEKGQNQSKQVAQPDEKTKEAEKKAGNSTVPTGDVTNIKQPEETTEINSEIKEQNNQSSEENNKIESISEKKAVEKKEKNDAEKNVENVNQNDMNKVDTKLTNPITSVGPGKVESVNNKHKEVPKNVESDNEKLLEDSVDTKIKQKEAKTEINISPEEVKTVSNPKAEMKNISDKKEPVIAEDSVDTKIKQKEAKTEINISPEEVKTVPNPKAEMKNISDKKEPVIAEDSVDTKIKQKEAKTEINISPEEVKTVSNPKEVPKNVESDNEKLLEEPVNTKIKQKEAKTEINISPEIVKTVSNPKAEMKNIADKKEPVIAEDSVELDMRNINKDIVNGKFYESKEKGIFIIPNLKAGEDFEKLNPEFKFIANIVNENFTYTGFLNEKCERNGFGRNFYKNKDIYLGEFKMNKRSAQGILMYNVDQDDELQLYNGFWDNGMKSKFGVYVWKKDSIVEGDEIPMEAFIGKFEKGIYSQGLYISQKVDGNDLKRYFYLGNFNGSGKKVDDKALYYMAHSKKLFYGKINDNELIKGQMLQVEEDQISISKGKVVNFEKNEQGETNFEDLSENNAKDLEEIATKFLTLVKDGDFFKKVLYLVDASTKQVEEFKKLGDLPDQETFNQFSHSAFSSVEITNPIAAWFSP